MKLDILLFLLIYFRVVYYSRNREKKDHQFVSLVPLTIAMKWNIVLVQNCILYLKYILSSSCFNPQITFSTKLIISISLRDYLLLSEQNQSRCEIWCRDNSFFGLWGNQYRMAVTFCFCHDNEKYIKWIVSYIIRTAPLIILM